MWQNVFMHGTNCNQHLRAEWTLKFLRDTGRLAVKTWKEWKHNGKKWKAHWNVLNCKLTFTRQKGRRSLENYCFNILLVIFLSGWGSEWRFLAVTNVMFVKSKLSHAAPPPPPARSFHAHTSSFSLFLVHFFIHFCFYCLFCLAFSLQRMPHKWMTGPPAGKKAAVFLWPASLSLYVYVCVCMSPVHRSSRSKCGFVILYLCVFVCLCVWACGGAIYA